MGNWSADPIEIEPEFDFISTLADPWYSSAEVDLQISFMLFSFTPLPLIKTNTSHIYLTKCGESLRFICDLKIFE